MSHADTEHDDELDKDEEPGAVVEDDTAADEPDDWGVPTEPVQP